MLPQNNPDRIRIVFDDHRLVANAGLLLPATLAQHLGRREARLTQAEVADLTGLSLSAIRRYEYGSANPETGTLDTLARIYDKPAGWFTPRGYFTVKERYQFQQSVRPRAVLENASTLYGEHLVLTDLQHQVVADSHDSVIGQYMGSASTSRHKAFVTGLEGPLGTLWFSPGVPADVYLDSVVGAERSGPSLSLLLILSGLLAVGVAMILTFFVSHRILRPVETLARVSRQAARRDFTVRAHVQLVGWPVVLAAAELVHATQRRTGDCQRPPEGGERSRHRKGVGRNHSLGDDGPRPAQHRNPEEGASCPEGDDG